MSFEEADVIIVGGGPVGLTLAADLSYREVSTILIERRPTTSSSPKAVALSSRTMEHFRRIGLQDKIQDASYPRDFPVAVMLTTGVYKGNVLFKKIFPSWGDVVDGKGKAEFPFFQDGASPAFPMLCPQFTSEAVIRKHIEETYDCSKLFWGWCVTAINQDEDGVQLTAVNQNGEEKIFKGKYLAACDGGRSFVRKELALHTYGKFVVLKALTICFSSTQLLKHLKETDSTGLLTVVNSAVTGVFITLNDKGQFAIHLVWSPSTPDEEVKWHVNNPGKCVEFVMGSSDVLYDVISVDGYNMHALVSTKFREGRCFFAGDSAHQWLPVGGLGLNTGISDVADLSWKLAALVKGYGGQFLMDSYEIERRPLVDSTRRFAMSMARENQVGMKIMNKIVPFIAKNPITRFLMGKFAGTTISQQFNSGIDLVLGFQYSNSNIIMHQYNEDGSIRLHCNTDCIFTPSSLPGCRAPHVALPECSSILDLFGKNFAVLTVGGAEADLKELRDALTKKGVPFNTHTFPALPELAQLYNRKYFLIRPDGVVAWRSDFQPSSMESFKIIATVLGYKDNPRLPPPISTYRDPNPPAVQSLAMNVLTRLAISGSLIKYTQLPLVTSAVVGYGFMFLRALSLTPPYRDVQFSSRHKAAIVSKYGDADSVLAVDPKHVGKFGPEDILVRVHASSISGLDLSMRMGRGATYYQKIAKLCFGGSYFPLILGRDCSGEVVAVGDSVTKFFPGDQVYAAIPPYSPGGHAQLVSIDQNCITFKPSNLDHKESASLPWVAMTAWSALVKCAGLNQFNTRGKKILVHHGTSDVGSFAVQLMSAWGAKVTTTCAKENAALAHHLGADKVLDDQSGDFSSILSGYDVVLNTVGGQYECSSLSTLKHYQQSVYVSTVSPYEKLVDSLGAFLGGIAFSTIYRFKIIFNRLFGGRGFFYSSTEIDAQALVEVRSLVEQGAIRPLINAVYSLDEIIDAHKHVETGPTRGKVVVAVP